MLYHFLTEFCFDYQAIFHQRYKVYQNWQSAQATLTKKREALVKLELAGKQEKIPPAQEEVKEVCNHHIELIFNFRYLDRTAKHPLINPSY